MCMCFEQAAQGELNCSEAVEQYNCPALHLKEDLLFYSSDIHLVPIVHACIVYSDVCVIPQSRNISVTLLWVRVENKFPVSNPTVSTSQYNYKKAETFHYKYSQLSKRSLHSADLDDIFLGGKNNPLYKFIVKISQVDVSHNTTHLKHYGCSCKIKPPCTYRRGLLSSLSSSSTSSSQPQPRCLRKVVAYGSFPLSLPIFSLTSGVLMVPLSSEDDIFVYIV